jgi:hypothetical protein
MTTVLHVVLRVLGVILGVIWVAFGPYISAQRGGFEGFLGALAFIILGVAFLRYGLSSPRTKPLVSVLPHKVRRAAALTIGIAFTVCGPYFLFARWHDPIVAILLCVSYVVTGAAVLWVWGLQRKAMNAA